MVIAAATTTGDWIIGGVALVIVLAVIIGIVWLLYRLVTWPARARRRRRSTGGLGSDYEQMIRQQRRNKPATGERPLPFPPPAARQQTTPAPAVSQVVLPPPGYRTREPEPPEVEPVSATTVIAEPSSAPPSTWERVMRTPRNTPAWATLALAWLGLWFIVSKPIFGSGWVSYGVGLVVAVGLGVWAKRNYHAQILWRAPRNVLVWQRWGKQDDSLALPVEVQAAAEAVAATEAPDSETPVADDLPAPTETPTPS